MDSSTQSFDAAWHDDPDPYNSYASYSSG